MEKNHLIQEMVNDETVSTGLVAKGVFNAMVDGNQYQNALCFLFEDCFVLKARTSGAAGGEDWGKLRMRLSFGLIFEAVHETLEQNQNKQAIFLIKFQRQKIYATINFSNNQKQYDTWRTHLASKINQRGFHTLFKAVKKIGKGNYANVYLVSKLQNEIKYAVKAFSKESIFSEEKGRESLMKQISIMRRFNHKNLMKIYEVYETDHSIYLVTELLEGGQLADKIHKKLSLAQMQSIMRSILEGLSVMHSAHIMHRDIKPENILLRRENDFDCVIVDFGLAECTEEEFLFARCGTPGYVAPQIVNLKDQHARYTSACDIFSLGIIFHMLLLKKSPFPGHQYDQVLRQNKALKFNFETHQFKQLPQNTLDLLKRMLQSDPEKRITAAEALSHSFFNSQYAVWDSSNKGHLLKIETRHLKEDGAATHEKDSPLMMSKNLQRKRAGQLRDDSCIKFKMKQNLMTGCVDNGEYIDEINSPELKKKRSSALKPESRFKRLANH